MSDTQLAQLTEAIHAMDKKFEARFQGIDDHFQGIDDNLRSIDNHFQGIDDNLRSIDNRFQTIDESFNIIEQKFNSMEDRFDIMEQKFGSMEERFGDQFIKLYKYTSDGFSKIHKRLDQMATKVELNTYANAVHAYLKKTETYHQEMLTLGHKVDRHEKWHHQTAKAVGVNLSS